MNVQYLLDRFWERLFGRNMCLPICKKKNHVHLNPSCSKRLLRKFQSKNLPESFILEIKLQTGEMNFFHRPAVYEIHLFVPFSVRLPKTTRQVTFWPSSFVLNTNLSQKSFQDSSQTTIERHIPLHIQQLRPRVRKQQRQPGMSTDNVSAVHFFLSPNEHYELL